MKTFETNRIIRGNYGRVWMNGERMANVKSFEAKVTLNYEDVELNDTLGTDRRYMGFVIEGTMTLHKYDSTVIKTYKEGIVTGVLPDLKFVAALDDSTAYGAERVEIYGVTIDEIMLNKFENKTVLEEEVPFKATGFHFIDTI